MILKVNESKQIEVLKEYNEYKRNINFLYKDIEDISKKQKKLIEENKKNPRCLNRYKIVEFDEEIHRKGEKIDKLQSKLSLLAYVIGLIGLDSLYGVDYSNGLYKFEE